MSDAQLTRTIAQLREELARLPEGDAVARARVGNLITALETRLASADPEQDGDTLAEALRDAIRHYEVEHPQLTGMLNQVLLTLANIGI